MIAIGTRVRLLHGYGTVSVVFADGPWAKKFLDCPKCDGTTWAADVSLADLTETGGPQYLVVLDAASRWYIVDEDVLTAAPTSQTFSASFKVGGTA